MRITRKDIIKLITSMPDGEIKRNAINYLLKSGEATEEEIAQAVIEDIQRNLPKYTEVFKTDDFLRFIWNRFQGYPSYLARALVQARPDLFYAYGFAFRLILKLKANLGTVTLPPRRPGQNFTAFAFMNQLPEMVKADIFALDEECHFREYLYVFSRDPQIGFEFLDEDIKKTDDEYDRRLLKNVRTYCQKLLEMKFPDFVKKFNNSSFPAFHVRWWIDQIEDVPRVLNIGDTGTQKTAFAVIAMQYYGCHKVLVLCTANARLHWKREITSYFEKQENHVFLVTNQQDIKKAFESKAQYIIVAYSNLIQSNVVQTLKTIPFDGLIWDECQYGKNLTGQTAALRAKACATLVKELNLKRLIALSATPWENHPIELGAIASALRPDIFPCVEIFRQARPEDPRFLREFFASQVIEVELREIKDLPQINPQPWENLFGEHLIPTNKHHQEIYTFVRENDEVNLQPAQKVERLLLTTVHPHKVKDKYQWPSEFNYVFDDWTLSTKLQWLKERVIKELQEGAKVVIGSGIFAQGITRQKNGNGNEIWVGKLLRQWFGEDHVIVIDGTVSQTIDKSGSSERDRLIQKWRSDPKARILLVSMRACPDSINLTVPKLEGVTKLFVTALSSPWVPWKPFLGRFWRDGQGVPVQYCVPILKDTIDESLLRLIQRKWEIQQLFRAQVPLTEEEIAFLDKRVNIRKLAQESKTDLEKVNIIGAMVCGQGEQSAVHRLQQAYGASTNAEVFAKAFIALQEYAASGHIARFMEPTMKEFELQGLVHPEGIFDAGCGPLTLERKLKKSVYGMDMNPHIIELARPLSPCHGKNTQVGFLSKLPKEWTGKFELTVASLVLDWTSLKVKIDEMPERLKIISELVRVTHPCGRIWITTTEKSMDENILKSWKEALKKQGFTIIEELTDLVMAKDTSNSKPPFAFWSLCFSPNGKTFIPRSPEAYSFIFETERMKKIRGGGKEQVPREHKKVIYQEFEVIKISGEKLKTENAAKQAANKEIDRLADNPNLSGWKFHQTPNIDWRTLVKLEKLGLLEKILENLQT